MAIRCPTKNNFSKLFVYTTIFAKLQNRGITLFNFSYRDRKTTMKPAYSVIILI